MPCEWLTSVQKDRGNLDLELLHRQAKIIELTELTRQNMRSGIQAQHPDSSESQIQRMFVNRLLSYHGTSLDEIRRLQQQEQASQ